MPDGAHHEHWHPRHNPWFIALAVMMAVFMEVLDTSIANIALPHIAGSLSATTDEATWVLTSYLVSNAIILPMTGWLGNYFGRKRVLLSCVVLFTFASVLCGLAWNLPTLILARIFQGIGGGAMVPIAQAVLLESFPVNKRGSAMAMFAMGVVVAPILGPTLGGWITDNYSWRWIFYINVPFGIAAVFLQQWLVEDPPYIKRNRAATIDFIGFALLAIWLATLQITLDKGQEEDWFQSNWICWLAAISVFSLIGFIMREFTAEHPLVDLRVFKNRNFAVGVLLMLSLAAILYGTTAELPLFLQTLMGYPALQSGYAMSPRGCAAFVTTFIVGRLVGRIRSRWLLCCGFTLLAESSFMLSDITLQVSQMRVIWPSIVNGIAISFIFVPLTTTTMSQLRQQQIGNATGLFNLVRNLGGSIGIAFVTTMLARGAQAHQALMVGHLTPTDPVFNQRLAAAHALLVRHGDPVRATSQAYSLVYNTLDHQAHLWAFVDNFRLFGLLALAGIPLIFLFKRVKRAPARAMEVH
jgi:MFS transporter, DHA2 family, multidrug resistance protein